MPYRLQRIETIYGRYVVTSEQGKEEAGDVPSASEADDEGRWPEQGRIDEERVAFLLAAGETQEAVAQTLGISARTIRRRLKQPEFWARLQEERLRLRMQDRRELADLRANGLKAIAELLGSTDPIVRLRAATLALRVHGEGEQALDRFLMRKSDPRGDS
jgi:hypothetical protein